MLNIRALAPSDHANWDKFVVAHPEATFFHYAAWREVLCKGFGFGDEYLVAERDQQLVGIAPMMHVRRPLIGDALISNPVCVYGGPLAVDDQVRFALEEAAARRGQALQVAYVEFRARTDKASGWPSSADYCSFGFPLSNDKEAMLASIPRKRRAEIRKAAAAGLTIETDSDIERFYPLYARAVRDLGSPVYPRKLFEEILAAFGQAVEITTLSHEGRPVLSLMSFWFLDQVLPYFVGAIPEAKPLRAFDHVYWDLACRAADKSCKWFDFGRSIVGSGAYESKKTWGLEPEPLVYQYHLVKSREVPHLNPDNALLRPAVSVWRKLPLVVTNALGPYLSRIAV